MHRSSSKGVRRTAGEVREALAPALGADRLRLGVPLAPYTTFRIGGPADVLYDATSADELATAVTSAHAAGIPCFVLGLGANILVGDRGVRGLVVRNLARGIQDLAGGRVRAESGVVIADLIRHAVARGRSGLEHYVGIPSTVGGAVWQNLHFLSPAPARERTMFIAEVVESVELVPPGGGRMTVPREAMGFGYDDSRLHTSGETALAVTFALPEGDPAVMHRVMQENLSWRGARHPWLEVHPSAGSVFKKIEGVGAGRLIDQCGLKGHRIGGAQISHIHANILVNLGGATAADVRALIALAQHQVRERFGQSLEPEIGFIGEFAEESAQLDAKS
ncbi:MAG: UDP-N-acetylmuramate dehydrogenase [Gemmatimonadaceae bacterium]|nr:UDP-N-acetylmuramate dehydrogenase [Gemmatimonadaceae bacterium]